MIGGWAMGPNKNDLIHMYDMVTDATERGRRIVIAKVTVGSFG